MVCVAQQHGYGHRLQKEITFNKIAITVLKNNFSCFFKY